MRGCLRMWRWSSWIFADRQRPSPYRRARACPSPCTECPKQRLRLQLVFSMPERSRGPVPRATVRQRLSPYRRARACPSPCLGPTQRLRGCGWFSLCLSDRGGNPLACACGRRGPPRYGETETFPFTVGRGPVPRHASVGTRNGLGRRARGRPQPRRCTRALIL